MVKLLSVFAALAVLVPTGIALKNLEVSRSYNLESTVVRERLEILVENDEQRPISEYILSVSSARKLGWYEVFEKESKTQLVSLKNSESDKEWSTIQVQFATPLAPNAKLLFVVKYVYMHELEPFPPRIKQIESQKLRFKTEQYFPSIYETKTQKTTFTLPNASLREYANIKPAETDKKEVKFGPFKDIASLYKRKEPEDELYVIYVQNKVPIKVKTQRREIEVSHWGANLAVEEHYSIQHTGAQLDGEFNRLLHMQFRNSLDQTSVYNKMVFKLPPMVNEVYYRDTVGNVSTSKTVSSKNEYQLELQPRFPMFGSWNYEFYYGYNQPLSTVLKRNATTGRYVLKVPLVDKGRDWQREHVIIRILLPEGVIITNIWLPVADVIPKFGYWRTYLDTKGRVGVWIEIKDSGVVDEWSKDLLIEYEHTFTAICQKPYTVATAFLILFVLSMIWARIDLGIARK